MSHAAAINHALPSKSAVLRLGTGPSVLLAMAALAFAAGTALAPAIHGLMPAANPPAANSHALEIRHALASSGSLALTEPSVPDASKVLAGAVATGAEPAPTF